MRTSDVISHFGSRPKIAEALGLSRAAVYAWDELVPPLQAAKLAELSNGILRFDLSAYSDWNRPKRQRRRKAI